MGRTAPPTTAKAERRLCATMPSASRNPIAASRPSEFQYPSGSESRSGRSGSLGRLEPIGKELGRQRVARNETDAAERAREDPRTVSAPHDDRHREGQCDVDEIRSTSRSDAEELIDHTDESAIHAASAPIPSANAMRSRPGTSARSVISSDARRDEERERHPPPGLREVGSFAGVRGCDDRGRGGSHDAGTQRPRYGRLRAVESADALRKV